MKRIIQISLAVVVIILGYLLVQSIMKPIRFNKEKDVRYAATIQRLKDIREVQVAYKSKYNKYTGSFDTLINFAKKDSFEIEKYIGEFDEDAMTKKEAIRLGYLKVVTTKVPVKDSLFRKNYPIDSLQYVPFTKGAKFEMGAGELETGAVTIQVFEAKVHNNVLLGDMNRQLRINFNDKWETVTKYKGLKVGSLEEANNNAGNWD